MWTTTQPQTSWGANKLPFVTLDIETANPPEEEIQAELANWKPSGNVSKAETIEKQKSEAEARIRDRAGLLDGAPVCSVAIDSPLGGLVLHTLKANPIPGLMHLPANDERSLLVMLRVFLDGFTDKGTVLVGHNIKGFDLPKLRLRFLSNGLKLPAILLPSFEIRVDDTMALFSRFFLIGERPFVTLNEVVRRLDISENGKAFAGKDIPQMVKDGRHAEIIMYNLLDAKMTTLAWKKLTSQIGD